MKDIIELMLSQALIKVKDGRLISRCMLGEDITVELKDIEKELNEE